jgi:hypothetical protein
MFALSSLLLCISLVYAQSTCTYTDATTGYEYDFTQLEHQNDFQFQYHSGTQTITMYISVCRPVYFPKCGAGSSACQQWDVNSPKGQASLGAASSGQWSTLKNNANDTGVTISYSGGDGGRSYEIDFVCSQDAGMEHKYIKWH